MVSPSFPKPDHYSLDLPIPPYTSQTQTPSSVKTQEKEKIKNILALFDRFHVDPNGPCRSPRTCSENIPNLIPPLSGPQNNSPSYLPCNSAIPMQIPGSEMTTPNSNDVTNTPAAVSPDLSSHSTIIPDCSGCKHTQNHSNEKTVKSYKKKSVDLVDNKLVLEYKLSDKILSPSISSSQSSISDLDTNETSHFPDNYCIDDPILGIITNMFSNREMQNLSINFPPPPDSHTPDHLQNNVSLQYEFFKYSHNNSDVCTLFSRI